MKRLQIKKVLLGGLLLLSAGALYGCGEEPYELEANEEAIIVNYAAHIVAKYNVKQPEGYQYVYIPEDDETTAEEQTQDPVQAQTNDTAQTQDQTGTADGTQQGADTTTLSEALGLKKVRAVYTGAELTDRYEETVLPESGKQLLVLHVALQNSTEKTQGCDLLAILPKFRVKVNQSVEADAELTILPDNLATWEADLPAGATEDTVIIFQLDQNAVTQIDQLELEVTTEQQTSRVVFL